MNKNGKKGDEMKRIKTLLYVLSVFSNVIAPPLLAQGK